jgi:hypothetical protein
MLALAAGAIVNIDCVDILDMNCCHGRQLVDSAVRTKNSSEETTD